MEGIKSTIINIVLIGIFIFALILFSFKFADYNTSTPAVSDDPSVNTFRTNLEDTLNSFSGDVNDSQNSFSQSVPKVGGDSILVLSVANIWKTLVSTPRAIYSLTLGLIFDKLFGDSAGFVVFTIFSSLLITVILFYSWRWIKSGEP